MSLASKGQFIEIFSPNVVTLTAVAEYVTSETINTSGYDDVVLALTAESFPNTNQTVTVIPVYSIVIPGAESADYYGPATTLPTIATGGGNGQIPLAVVNGANGENIFLGGEQDWGNYATIRPVYTTPPTIAPLYSSDIFFTFPVMNANKMKFLVYKRSGTAATRVYALASLIRRF